MHSDWFSGIDILQGRWQHGEKVGYCYPSRLKKTLCKWEVYVPLVTKGLNTFYIILIVGQQFYCVSLCLVSHIVSSTGCHLLCVRHICGDIYNVVIFIMWWPLY
jgi:hypothetical protein